MCDKVYALLGFCVKSQKRTDFICRAAEAGNSIRQCAGRSFKNYNTERPKLVFNINSVHTYIHIYIYIYIYICSHGPPTKT